MPAEPLPNLARAALVIRPREPFLDWLIELDPETTFDDEFLAGDVYLLPDFESREEMQDWLRENFEQLFSVMLNNWYLDERMWPDDRNWAMFEAWFACSFHPLVFDTMPGDIDKF